MKNKEVRAKLLKLMIEYPDLPMAKKKYAGCLSTILTSIITASVTKKI